MTGDQISELRRSMLEIQGQMNRHVAAVRDIADKIKSGQIGRQTAATYRAEIMREGQYFQECAERGVAVYGKLKAAGYSTKELDEWCEKVLKLST
jgi:hypothetical protein